MRQYEVSVLFTCLHGYSRHSWENHGLVTNKALIAKRNGTPDVYVNGIINIIHGRVKTRKLFTTLIYVLQLIFFIPGNFYFSSVSTALAYITIQQNKRKTKITWNKKLTIYTHSVILWCFKQSDQFSIQDHAFQFTVFKALNVAFLSIFFLTKFWE